MLAATGDDRDVQDVFGVGESAVGITPVADENGILGNDWGKVGRERGSLEPLG